MTYITEDIKQAFKDFLAEQDFIYDDNKTGLTDCYYWDYRDIIDVSTMKKLIERYSDQPTLKEALHQYALENDMFEYEETRQRNAAITFMESLGVKYTDATEDFLEELLELFYDLVTIDTNLERIITNTPTNILDMYDEREKKPYVYL